MEMNQQSGLPLDKILTHGTDVVCENCGNRFFKKSLAIKKVSKLITLTPDDQIFYFSVIQCSECGHVNKDFEIK